MELMRGILPDDLMACVGSGSGVGSGDGSGYGAGSSSSDGYGAGAGYGYGSGSGNGSGNGSGYGYGAGNGNGYGYGAGYGSGSGSGNGSGYGNGNGSGYGSGSGDGSGYGYGSGAGSGSGDGSGYDASLRAQARSLLSVSLWRDPRTLALWKSDDDGRPANGGEGEAAYVGRREQVQGPLKLCTPRCLHATLEPSVWKGSRRWIVALDGDVIADGAKLGALDREILAEVVRADGESTP